jgi:hypothetical protein
VPLLGVTVLVGTAVTSGLLIGVGKVLALGVVLLFLVLEAEYKVGIVWLLGLAGVTAGVLLET